jgi:glycosyltransferase involved in cell wall biosynthesis
MRILFLSTWFPHPLDNGSKIRVYHLLQALATRHRVSLISFSFGTADTNGVSELHRLCERVRFVERDPFQRDHRAALLRFLSPVPTVTRSWPDMERLVRQVLEKDSFDVVIASTAVMATYALQVSGAVRVLEEHNSMTRWMQERYLGQATVMQRLRCWGSWQKTRAYERGLFRQFDLCTMVSEQDRVSSEALLPPDQGRVEVVPNGVDCGHNHPGLGSPQPGVLVYNGSLTYSANYGAMAYFLSEIYPLIQREEPGVSLVITGSVDGVDLAGLNLDDSVQLSGYVADVRPLVAGASVCVVPIRQGGGTRLKILEAMALGTPVVCTPKGGEGLCLVPDHDMLIAPEPEDFAAAVVRLLREPILRLQLARNARKTVEQRYDWVAIGRTFRHLVEDVAQQRAVK